MAWLVIGIIFVAAVVMFLVFKFNKRYLRRVAAFHGLSEEEAKSLLATDAESFERHYVVPFRTAVRTGAASCTVVAANETKEQDPPSSARVVAVGIFGLITDQELLDITVSDARKIVSGPSAFLEVAGRIIMETLCLKAFGADMGIFAAVRQHGVAPDIRSAFNEQLKVFFSNVDSPLPYEEFSLRMKQYESAYNDSSDSGTDNSSLAVGAVYGQAVYPRMPDAFAKLGAVEFQVTKDTVEHLLQKQKMSA